MMERLTADARKHQGRLADRNLDFPQTSAESWTTGETDGKAIDLQEAITFGWYPWAIESAVWWLAGAPQKEATLLETNRVARVLGHFVEDLGTEAVREYSTPAQSFRSSPSASKSE